MNPEEDVPRGSAASGEGPRDLSHLAHRRWIGYLGFLLPVLLVALTAIRDDSGLDQPLGSVSAYYYTGAVGVFVGVLFALSGFLLTYRGYRESRADQILGIFGGFCAICVALFPTEAPLLFDAAPWWTPVAGMIHYSAAVLLFLTFIAFSLWLFRKTDVPPGERLPPEKLRRNRTFLACGLVMIVAIVWAGFSGTRGESIFWQEVIALWAFAASWLVKGEAPARAMEFVQRVVADSGSSSPARD